MSSTPEAVRLIQIDPADLMRDNPAALIVNLKSYGLMEGHFSPEQMDPPQILRVATFDGDQKEVVRLFIKDGMTRTKYSDDHRDAILPDYPDFRFSPITVRDVTESELKNPRVVLPTESREGQSSLTMLQYLRSVVPPTVEHSEIASSRIAAHLINGWENMVGPDLSERFSALAAISLLDNPNVPTATDIMFRKFIESQEMLVVGETVEDRAKIQDGLLQMVSIIRETRLMKKQIAESAYILVSAGSEVIGGEVQMIRQIYGLLNTPEFIKRLELSQVELSGRESRRAQIVDLITGTLGKLPPTPRSQTLSLLSQLVRDPLYTLPQIENIFGSEAPLEKFEQVKLEENVIKLRDKYTGLSKKSELSSYEDMLVSNLGSVAYLPDREMDRVASVIKVAVEVLGIADEFLDDMRNNKDYLLTCGVNPSLIEEVLISMEKAQSDLLSAQSHTVARIKLHELRTLFEDKQRRVNFQKNIFAISNITDEVFQEELQSAQGAVIKESIAICIMREIGDEVNESKARVSLESLKSLSPDLQARVIKGEMRLKVAVQKGLRRDSSEMLGVEEEDNVFKFVPTVDATDQGLDNLQDAESQRIRINNQKFIEGVDALRVILESLDLENDEVSSNIMRRGKELIKDLGRLLYSHPDVDRVIQEHPRLIDELTKLREGRIQQEQAELNADTRTQI